MHVHIYRDIPLGLKIYVNISVSFKVYKRPNHLRRLKERYEAMSRDDQDVLIAALTGVTVRRLIYLRSGP